MKKRKSKTLAVVFAPATLTFLVLFLPSPYSIALLQAKSHFIEQLK